MRTLAGVLVVCAACGGAPSVSTPQRAPAPAAAEAEEAPVDPCAEVGRWQPVAALDLPGRVDHTAVWTGTEMIVWGGTRSTMDPRGDGARYRPDEDRWSPMTWKGLPAERDDHAAVWTGTEMIVWGGNHFSEKTEKLATGGRYDPAEDRWRPIAATDLSARDDPRAVWTGTEMIVWGGRDRRGTTDTGAIYDPAKDAWRPMSTDGAPEPREDHTAVWTGTEMIVWGGWTDGKRGRDYALHGGRYDPETDTWRPISEEGAPDPREDHTAVWTGTEMIVWGGMVHEASGDGGEGDAGEAPETADAADAPSPRSRRQLATGGRYDPATDTWSPLAMEGAPTPREDDVVVWTGTEMLVWGGQEDDVPVDTGARYAPAADVWCPITSDGALSARRDAAGVWTGSELVIWGGRGTETKYPTDAAAYVP